jgi:Domain of unknown function (DUF397)
MEQVENGWRKSSHSGNGANCVELGSMPDAILIRDTTDRGGHVLSVSRATWTTFLATLR